MFVKPFVTLLRIVDTNNFFMRKIYWLMSQTIDLVKNNGKLLAKEHKYIVFCATQRWIMMHEFVYSMVTETPVYEQEVLYRV